MPTEKYDFLIIGGGLFGVYAAIFLAEKGLKVALVEKEKKLFQKASIVNQARLHGGYHYPRSVATALMSDENKVRFTTDHKDFINFSFQKYYGIDRYASFTDSQQFERFCDYIGLPYEDPTDLSLFNTDRLERVYKTVEYSFDPILIANYYQQRIKSYATSISIKLFHKVLSADGHSGVWQLKLHDLALEKTYTVYADQVINATYAGSNSINQLFDLPELKLSHEISEIAFVSSPQVKNMGLTIMDGQFASIMPYGRSDLLSLSSVAYTHHKVSYENLPHFDCMNEIKDCSPNFTSICNHCIARPKSNYRKMMAQIKNYFSEKVQINYFFSYFTIKSKLQANYIDDGRPTEISILNKKPPFYCIFAGKINSIYEIEKILKI